MLSFANWSKRSEGSRRNSRPGLYRAVSDAAGEDAVSILLHDIVIDEKGGGTQLAMIALSGLERGKQWRFMVKENKARHTKEQKAYYHAVIVPYIANFTGDSQADTHAHMKREFLPKVQRTFRGDTWTETPSTTELNRGEFSEQIIEQIIAWAATELGVIVPPPRRNR